MTELSTLTLDVPGAVLTYDVRPGTDSATPLVMVASPMGAAGFTTLAGHFTDRTVVTYDPRHSNERSRLTTDEEPTPETHADDIHRVIQAALGSGPVDVLASSGGAVNMLALVAAYPDAVRILVAHEPPLVSQLPDREAASAAVRDTQETYQREGLGPGMAKFLNLIMYRGEITADWAEQPDPDLTQFGLPTEDDGSRDDPMLGRGNLVNITHYEPDFDAMRAASTGVVVAAGAESEGEIAHRGALAVSERLGVEPTIFPSHHGGFLGGEYGQTGDPDAFAQTLHQVLDTPG